MSTDGIKVTKAPAVLFRLGHKLDGTLHLMRHHMVFKADQREIWICYPIIAELTRCGNQIRIICRDFMFIGFEFGSEPESRLAFETIEELRSVRSIDQLYAFLYSPATLEKNFNGWEIYDAEREYKRMGALDPGSKWRLSLANANHTLCPTYPRVLVVPASISDNVLAYAAKFRSKGRFPVLSYFLTLNKCTISRCSQPLVGIKQSRSMQDEAIVSAIWSTNESPSGLRGAQHDHLVMDLRPSTNAIAQVALGGGTENMDRYRPARKMYMGVDNLHVMRDSLLRVQDALRHSDVGDEPPNPHSLERSQWLKHIQLLIETSRTVVQQVYFKCSHVVVHCSDGWDRTPQITSLAMLCLDPYYRTLEGFFVLVEKEWVSFGHQFSLRSNFVNKKNGGGGGLSGANGNGNGGPDTETEENDIFKNVTNFLSETTKGRQDGPIFQQFLDTVYQLLMVFPNAFEFNERFLRRLLYHTYAGQYGTFLFNSEREAIAQDVSVRTRSVWDYFLARKSQFVNPHFTPPQTPSEQVLIVPSDWKPRWWSGEFGRVDSDMNDRNAWRMRPVRKTANTASTAPALSAVSATASATASAMASATASATASASSTAIASAAGTPASGTPAQSPPPTSQSSQKSRTKSEQSFSLATTQNGEGTASPEETTTNENDDKMSNSLSMGASITSINCAKTSQENIDGASSTLAQKSGPEIAYTDENTQYSDDKLRNSVQKLAVS